MCVSRAQCFAALVPSLRPEWGKSWAASTGFWGLSPFGLSSGRNGGGGDLRRARAPRATFTAGSPGMGWLLPSPTPCRSPSPGKTVPHHPLGDGCQVTVPHPPLGDRTTTVHAHLQAHKLQHKTILPSRSYVMRRYASPTTCAKTGSPVERMNITFVPGGNMVVLSSSISAKVSKMSCHECKGYKWQCPTTQSPTQQHNEPQQKILG